MFGVDAEVEETWSRPHEGFDDKDEETVDIDYVKLGRKLVSRFMYNGSGKDILPYLLSLIH